MIRQAVGEAGASREVGATVGHNRAVSARVVSVHVGSPVDADWAGRLRRTAIDKRTVDEPVSVYPLGIAGDQVADTEAHGGVYQAVYAFAREDLDWWEAELGRPIADGQFGENLTTAGLDVNHSLVGEQWQIGTTVLEVASVRIPCRVFQNWLGETGYDNHHWIKRFTQQNRPGPYLRVVEPGTLRAGDPLTVVHTPSHEVTVSTMFRALTTERSLLPRLLDSDEALPPRVREVAERYATSVV